MTKPMISLADALMCQTELATAGSATLLMLRMLGLEAMAAALEQSTSAVRETSRPPDLHPVRVIARDKRPLTKSRPVVRRPDSTIGGAVKTSGPADADRHEALVPTTGTPPDPRGIRVRVLPNARPTSASNASARSPALKPASTAAPPPAPPPLFPPLRRRGILTALVATPVREGGLDIREITTAVIQRRPLSRLPRRWSPTVRHGVRLLVDRADSLAPFRTDQDELIVRLVELLGKDRVELLEFCAFPGGITTGHGQADSASLPGADNPTGPLLGAGPSPQRPIRPGTPVLIVSDFSIRTRPDDEQWVPSSRWCEFADELRARGSSVVGLVPYARTRWPSKLSTAMSCVPWSERTTAGTVRRVVRRHWHRRA